MRHKKTERGFSYSEFKDSYGQKCVLQKSSSAIEDKIWFGISNPKLTVFQDNKKGNYIVSDMPDNFSVNSKMHLTRDQVKNLLPYLQKFVETGELE